MSYCLVYVPPHKALPAHHPAQATPELISWRLDGHRLSSQLGRNLPRAGAIERCQPCLTKAKHICNITKQTSMTGHATKCGATLIVHGAAHLATHIIHLCRRNMRMPICWRIKAGRSHLRRGEHQFIERSIKRHTGHLLDYGTE
jgi:hypothetical protein